MIGLDILVLYWKIGFKLVPLNELSMCPTLAWSDIYDNSNFWSLEKFEQYANKFKNLATTFGQSPITDSQGRKLFFTVWT